VITDKISINFFTVERQVISVERSANSSHAATWGMNLKCLSDYNHNLSPSSFTVSSTRPDFRVENS